MPLLRSWERGFDARLREFVGTGAPDPKVREAAAAVIADVRRRGDAGVLAATARFDGARLTAARLRIPAAELAAAAKALPAARRRAILAAIASVREFHLRTVPKGWSARNRHGAMVGERHIPIRRCGLYIPGGQVPLVSTVVMTAVPAAVAGVPEVVACTPPGPGGKVHPDLLAVLHLCGVREAYRIGGIQAVAAMAVGTRSVPAVDKVFGPGNAYVTEAKRQLFGEVGVDLLPGPSEVMVIADGTADPEWVAADLCAQAEHGSGKEKLYLVTDRAALPAKVLAAAGRQCATLAHGAKVRRILADRLLTVVVRRLADAAAVAERVAPEHLELMVAPGKVAGLARAITTAGAMLLGHETPTVLGDFVAGPSHTLPTGGTGRFFSGLRVADFLRRTSVVRYDARSLRRAAPTVAAFAAMERLDAHGRSLAIRLGAR